MLVFSLGQLYGPGRRSGSQGLYVELVEKDGDDGRVTTASWHGGMPAVVLPLLAAALAGREIVKRRRDADSPRKGT